MSRLTPEQLEAQVHALLRTQPLRRAPVSLEARVLAELSRRAALPWWHKSYAEWPTAVRLAFVVLGLGVAALIISAATLAFGGVAWPTALRTAFAPIFDTIAAFRTAGGALVGVVHGWISNIPSLWLYGILAGIGAAYATLLGLGATAYRLVMQPR